MLILGIDTAGSRCSACLFDGADVLARADPDIGKGHAERLMDLIAGLFTEAGRSYADLSRIAVVVGPGSFTGLRVGVAAARGLSLALHIPAIGVGALEALTEPCLGRAPVLAVLDAKRGEVYAALYGADGAELAAPSALAPEALPGFAASLPAGSPLVLTGSGAAIAGTALDGRFVMEMAERHEVDIAAVARIGAKRHPDASPRPMYLRGADAKPPSRVPLGPPGVSR